VVLISLEKSHRKIVSDLTLPKTKWIEIMVKVNIKEIPGKSFPSFQGKGNVSLSIVLNLSNHELIQQLQKFFKEAATPKRSKTT
jgi:hypothetical protein